MVIVVSAFVVCWTPYVVVICLDFVMPLSRSLHIWVTYLAHLHSILNVFIYRYSNREWRVGYRMVLLALYCKTPPEAPPALSNKATTEEKF